MSVLGDAWRGSLNRADESAFYIAQHTRTLAGTNERDKKTAAIMLPIRIKMYLEAVRRVTYAQEEMDADGIAYVRKNAW